MTAPTYPDEKEVYRTTRSQIVEAIGDDTFETELIRMAKVALDLWDARDSARATAAMQDKATRESMISHAKELKRAQFYAWNDGYCSLGDDLGWKPGAWPDKWNDLDSHSKNPYGGIGND